MDKFCILSAMKKQSVPLKPRMTISSSCHISIR